MNKRIERIIQVYQKNAKGITVQSELISDMYTKKNVSLILSLAAIILSIMNIIKGYRFMAFTTIMISLAFLACYFLADKIKNYELVTFIMATTIIFIFTYYACSGQNEGFAILWTLIVPPIAMLLLGINIGTLISCYFEVLLLILFYTPLRNYVGSAYSSTFMNRYPILYLVALLTAIYLTANKEYYRQKTADMAREDGLTGLYNRRYYDEELARLNSDSVSREYTIYAIDVNRLKYTNDTFGHEAGDALLVAVAEWLKKSFPAGDKICRTGGDEFAIISYADQASREKIERKLADFVFYYKGKLIEEPSLSFGRASKDEYPDCELAELIKIADSAMYTAKEEYYQQNGFERRRY